MTRIGPVSWKKFDKFLKKHACYPTRQKGSHQAYRKEGLRRPIIIPKKKELEPWLIHQTLRSLQIAYEEFLKFMGKSRK